MFPPGLQGLRRTPLCRRHGPGRLRCRIPECPPPRLELEEPRNPGLSARGMHAINVHFRDRAPVAGRGRLARRRNKQPASAALPPPRGRHQCMEPTGHDSSGPRACQTRRSGQSRPSPRATCRLSTPIAVHSPREGDSARSHSHCLRHRAIDRGQVVYPGGRRTGGLRQQAVGLLRRTLATATKQLRSASAQKPAPGQRLPLLHGRLIDDPNRTLSNRQGPKGFVAAKPQVQGYGQGGGELPCRPVRSAVAQPIG